MIPNPSQVIVMAVEYLFHSVHAQSVYHRGFPEVRAEGGTTEDAADRLAELLFRTLDSAPSGWHKETLEHAIEDVRAFAERGCSEPACGLSAMSSR